MKKFIGLMAVVLSLGVGTGFCMDSKPAGTLDGVNIEKLQELVERLERVQWPNGVIEEQKKPESVEVKETKQLLRTYIYQLLMILGIEGISDFCPDTSPFRLDMLSKYEKRIIDGEKKKCTFVAGQAALIEGTEEELEKLLDGSK